MKRKILGYLIITKRVTRVILFGFMTAAICVAFLSSCATGYKIHRYSLSDKGLDLVDYGQIAVLLVGSPYVVNTIDGIKAELATISRLGQRCDVLELSPGDHSLGLMRIETSSGSETITTYGSMGIRLDPGMVYRVYAELSDLKHIPRIETVGPVVFPATDGSAIARFVRLSEPTVVQGALFGYEVMFPGESKSLYPIYDDDYASFYPMISPNGKKLSLVRVIAGKKTLYLDGKEYELDDITIFSWGTVRSCVRYSADSGHFLFVGKTGSSVRVYHDGLPQEPYAKLSGLPAFSPNGEKYFYVADNEAILNGEVIFTSDEITGPNFGGEPFSPDSEHLFFVFKKGGQEYVWLDGNIGPGFDSIFWLYNFTWSDDGEYFLYKARKNKEYEILINHIPVATLERQSGFYSKLTFSENNEFILCSYKDGVNIVIKQYRNPLFMED
jgi:hypothetical protein